MAGSQVSEVWFIQIILTSETAFSFCKFANFLLFQVQSTPQQPLVPWGLARCADVQTLCQAQSQNLRFNRIPKCVVCTVSWRNVVLTQSSGSEMFR